MKLGLSPSEITALENINHTLLSYKHAILQAVTLIKSSKSIEEVDKMIKVSDVNALNGFKTLTLEIAKQKKFIKN